MKILYFFLFLWVIFALLDPDPDSATQINADPCGSGYETLVERIEEILCTVISNTSCVKGLKVCATNDP